METNSQVITNKTFDAAFKRKSTEVQKRITKTLRLLATDLKHPSLRVHQVNGTDGVWEAYVDRTRNRITFRKDYGTIYLLNNCSHDILRGA